MKTLSKCLLYFCVILSTFLVRGQASVHDSNYDPNYVKKVIMRSTVTCPYYWTTFTCEHYLAAGETMDYVDYWAGDCSYVYSPDSTTWIPGGISAISLVNGSGWEFAPSVQNGGTTAFFNYGSDSMTIRAKSGNGSLISGGLQWHITNLATDVVTHDWALQDQVSLGSLSSGPAFLIKVRFTGSGLWFQTRLDFADGSVAYGANGNPNKIRSDDTYPYGQERRSSCSLGCLRNVLAIKGKSVPSEDQLITIMGQNGKPESDFINTGMGDEELAGKYNIVLNPASLSATRLNTTQTEIINKLNNGSVMVVATILNSNDRNGQITVNPNHVVVIRKSGAKYEVIDPASGKALKVDLETALRYFIWAGTPVSTGRAWEIQP